MEDSRILDENIVEQDQQVQDRHITSGGKRFVNYLIDYFIVYVLIIGVMALFVVVLGRNAIGTLEVYAFALIISLAYYTLFEFYFGKTIGKMVTKTRVVNDDFSKLSFGTALKRSFCRLIPFEPFSCLGSSPAGWHDTIPGVWVIDEGTIS